jgi:hypothetical protein
VDPLIDTLLEHDDTVAISISPSTNYIFGPTTGVTGTIANDDLQLITWALSGHCYRGRVWQSD